MIYDIAEIFYSIQGEGFMSGTPAIFIRLAGCNRNCEFCDTDHNVKMRLCADKIIDSIRKHQCKSVVLTGGEPTAQNLVPLIEKLFDEKCSIQVETNGLDIETYINYPILITCSPKAKIYLPKKQPLATTELKLLYPMYASMIGYFTQFKWDIKCIQPVEIKGNFINVQDCINFIKENPGWRLSIQTQKILKMQ